MNKLMPFWLSTSESEIDIRILLEKTYQTLLKEMFQRRLLPTQGSTLPNLRNNDFSLFLFQQL